MFWSTFSAADTVLSGSMAERDAVGEASIASVKRVVKLLAASVIGSVLVGELAFAQDELMNPKWLMEYSLSEYRGCIIGAALALEPSGEPASTVAIGALTSCKEERSNFIVAAGLFGISEYKLSAKEVEGAMEEHIVRIDEALRREAELSVLQKRAAARSKQTP